MDKRFKLVEVPTLQGSFRGSESKLSTFSDGFKVLKMIFSLFKDYKPLVFFHFSLFFLFLVGLIIGLPVIAEFANTASDFSINCHQQF